MSIRILRCENSLRWTFDNLFLLLTATHNPFNVMSAINNRFGSLRNLYSFFVDFSYRPAGKWRILMEAFMSPIENKSIIPNHNIIRQTIIELFGPYSNNIPILVFIQWCRMILLKRDNDFVISINMIL